MLSPYFAELTDTYMNILIPFLRLPRVKDHFLIVTLCPQTFSGLNRNRSDTPCAHSRRALWSAKKCGASCVKILVIT